MLMARPSATRVSPTSIRSRILKATPTPPPPPTPSRFTHVDPFEDTERWFAIPDARTDGLVSPTSIRSRILKARPGALLPAGGASCFTHVDPFEDTESCLLLLLLFLVLLRFTHVDPFEDTESFWPGGSAMRQKGFHPRRSVRGY